MKMNGIAADLIRPRPRHTAFAVEFRAVQHAHPGAAQFLERRVPNVDVGMRKEQGMTASARRIFRSDDDFAADIADVRQEFDVAGVVARSITILYQISVHL